MEKKYTVRDRIVKVADVFLTTKEGLAKSLGVSKKTFYNHLNKETDDAVWCYLPKLLELFPRLSRQWLYFNEGPMTIRRGASGQISLRQLAGIAEQIMEDAGGSYRDLLEYVIGMPHDDEEESVQENSDPNMTNEAQTKIRALEEHIRELKYTVEVQRQLLEKQTGGFLDKLVHGENGVAHASQRDSE